MKFFVFDTETTGLFADHEVIQLSGFLVNENLKIEKIINWYCYSNKNVYQDSIKIHGIDMKTLLNYSGGKVLEDYLEDEEFLLHPKDIIFVGYNVSFDIQMVNQTLLYNGHPEINFGSSITAIPDETNGKCYNLCLCNTLKKNLNLFKKAKLEKLVTDTFGEDNKPLILSKLNQIAKARRVNLPQKELTFHDSLYDAFVTLLLLKKYIHFYRE